MDWLYLSSEPLGRWRSAPYAPTKRSDFAPTCIRGRAVSQTALRAYTGDRAGVELKVSLDLHITVGWGASAAGGFPSVGVWRLSQTKPNKIQHSLGFTPFKRHFDASLHTQGNLPMPTARQGRTGSPVPLWGNHQDRTASPQRTGSSSRETRTVQVAPQPTILWAFKENWY